MGLLCRDRPTRLDPQVAAMRWAPACVLATLLYYTHAAPFRKIDETPHEKFKHLVGSDEVVPQVDNWKDAARIDRQTDRIQAKVDEKKADAKVKEEAKEQEYEKKALKELVPEGEKKFEKEVHPPGVSVDVPKQDNTVQVTDVPDVVDAYMHAGRSRWNTTEVAEDSKADDQGSSTSDESDDSGAGESDDNSAAAGEGDQGSSGMDVTNSGSGDSEDSEADDQGSSTSDESDDSGAGESDDNSAAAGEGDQGSSA